MIIFIFGDSITQGLWDSKGGWADRIKAYVQSEEIKSGFKNYHSVFNLGVDGNFTKQILDRFEAETTASLWPNEQYAFIFATGTNDVLYREAQGFASTPEKYESELSQLVDAAKKYSQKLLFVDLTPLDESLTNPIKSSSTGKCYTNERINKFNEVLHAFCDKQSLPCVRVSEMFLQRDHKKLVVDGVHPNDEGHEIIYNEVLPIVKSWHETY